MSEGSVHIVRLAESLPDEFEALRSEASAESFAFIEGLRAEWLSGQYGSDDDRFAAFAAYREGELAGIGAVTPDPYDPAPDLLRVRHVYVRPLHRAAGVGRVLATALIQQGLELAPRLSLRAADPRAAAFWEANGFTPDNGGTRRSHLLTR
ncbi:GNAT family N-acetyltransferase [Bosea sp. SSUT16]|uniref:GNAT family N-acetyltransferase n=1 Tax=Bosea spartocytisi TaxID=2773451 RepID=A0A927E9F8_9HYPH|nr:GNAT family N-acetyltransferase [Bosea spartocytisi]MBD3845296.1 GNAT family N-acetyltransferase [Bosea spartocytisi]MCT4472467.1 GNAT family N-acetyltransferase [Bosea spartocytisi]